MGRAWNNTETWHKSYNPVHKSNALNINLNGQNAGRAWKWGGLLLRPYTTIATTRSTAVAPYYTTIEKDAKLAQKLGQL